MISDQEPISDDPRYKKLTLALAFVAVAWAGLQPALYSLLPNEFQPWNFVVIGAIGLFSGSRLGFWWSVALTGLSIGFKDASYYFVRGWQPYYLSWPLFLIYGLLGSSFLRRTNSPLWIGSTALSGSLLFFLVSNFESWVSQTLPYGYTWQGLLDCYVQAVPFFRGTILGDLAFTGLLFAAHAVLIRAHLPRPATLANRVETHW